MDVLSRFLLLWPYPLVSRMLWWAGGQGWVRRFICPQTAGLFRCLANELRYAGGADDLVRRGLAACFHEWRLVALGRMAPAKRARWVTVKGEPILRQSLEKGKGVVVVNNHYPASTLVLLLLQEMGIHDLLGIRGRPELSRSMGVRQHDEVVPHDANALATEDGLRLMALARQTLMKGGVVHMAGDGCRGAGRVPFDYHGKRVHFRTGFAELALGTGADVVPVFAPLYPDGNVVVEFLEPLTYDAATSAHEEAVTRLVTRYATLLAERWGKEPWNTCPYQLGQFLERESVPSPGS